MKWKTGCYECSKLRDDHISWFFDKTEAMWKHKKTGFANLSKLAVVGVSEWITKEAQKSFLNNAAVIKKIYNGIDVETFCPKDVNDLKCKMKLDDCKVILGVAYTWSNKKGLDKFIELSTKLQENQKIVLVGNMGRSIELPENIISVPLTNNIEELVDYYNMADVFLQMSEEETFGKVVAEALACGTPVITNSGTANPELVDESCGIVLDTLTPESILEAINKIFEQGKSYYSAQCIKHAKENFDKELCFEKYLELYKELLNGE
jgi:glycosyltransferase involved in cell wall biosynthesis